MPTATPRHHLWLESFAIGALFRTEDSAKLIPRSVELRRAEEARAMPPVPGDGEYFA